MQCNICVVVVVIAVLSGTTAASVQTPVVSDGAIEARALGYVRKTTIAAKILCVTDTIERVVTEYQCQSLWRNVEDKLQTSIGNMFLCLKYQGFQVQGCVAKEVFTTGLAMNSLLSGLDKESPEAGKQLRLRIAQYCSN